MNSLRLRLLISAGLILLLFLLLTGLALDRAVQSYTERAEYERLQGILFSLLGATEVDDQGQVSCSVGGVPEPRLQQPDSGLNVIIYDVTGQPRWTSPSLLETPEPIQPPNIDEWVFSAGKIFQLSYGYEWYIGVDELKRFTMRVEDRASPIQSERQSFTGQMWWWLLGISVALLVVLFVLMQWVLKPLGRIAGELDDIRAGKQEKLSSGVPTEILPLTQSVNALLDQEHQQQQRFRHALANLAHSLKTPLAVLGNMQNIETSQAEQLNRMEEIISYQLQKAATVGGRALRKPIPLRPVVERLMGVMKKVYADKTMTFDNQVPASFSVTVESGDLLELMGTLLDNAAKYGHHNIKVFVPEGAVNTVIVQDDGGGFAADAETLLQRGQRADTQMPGQGIGLAVAREIADAYQMPLRLEPASPQGARVVLVFQEG